MLCAQANSASYPRGTANEQTLT